MCRHQTASSVLFGVNPQTGTLMLVRPLQASDLTIRTHRVELLAQDGPPQWSSLAVNQNPNQNQNENATTAASTGSGSGSASISTRVGAGAGVVAAVAGIGWALRRRREKGLSPEAARAEAAELQQLFRDPAD